MTIPGQGGLGIGNLVAVLAAPGLLDQERLELEELREKKRRRQEQNVILAVLENSIIMSSLFQVKGEAQQVCGGTGR